MGKVDIIGHQTLETMAFAKWYNKWLYSLMKRHLGKEILEVGSGIGNFTRFLAMMGNVTATDYNENYIEKLKKENISNIKIGFADIEKSKYFFKQRKFDSIVCLNVLEHIEKDNKALANMNKLLKKGGRLILLVPAFMFLYSDFDKSLGHFRRYDKNDLKKKLEKAGFSADGIRYLNWWALIGWFLFIKIPKRKIMPKPPVAIFDILGKLFLLPEKYFAPPFGLSVFVIAEKK